jgi:hypothetical protein
LALPAMANVADGSKACTMRDMDGGMEKLPR